MTPTFYICQHGDALTKETDPDRPLSERGIADVCNVANLLSGSVDIELVIHSGKTRARQTAELLHERLAPEVVIRTESGLGPDDPVDDFLQRFASQGKNVLVVSHLPFVGRLASRLLGHGHRDVLRFEPGAIASLARVDDEIWELAWMLTPELLRE